MLARLQLALAAALGLIALALGAVLLLDRGDARGEQAFSVGPQGFAGAVSPPGARAVPFRLRDQDGRIATLAAERGKVTVVTFLYTTCEDTCPVAASQVLGALEELGPDAAAIPTYAISVDPRHDTPARAKEFLLARRLTGRMRFALGTEAELRPVWDGYGVRPQGPDRNADDFEHSARLVVIDKRGFQRVAFPLDQLSPPALAHDLRKLQAE